MVLPSFFTLAMRVMRLTALRMARLNFSSGVCLNL